MWGRFIGSEQGVVTVVRAHDNETSDYIKTKKFLDQLSDDQRIQKETVPWT